MLLACVCADCVHVNLPICLSTLQYCPSKCILNSIVGVYASDAKNIITKNAKECDQCVINNSLMHIEVHLVSNDISHRAYLKEGVVLLTSSVLEDSFVLVHKELLQKWHYNQTYLFRR